MSIEHEEESAALTSGVERQVPIYVVWCELEHPGSVDEPRVLRFKAGEEPTNTEAMDSGVAAALPGILYALHLPRDPIETLDLPLETVQAVVEQHVSPTILLVPVQALDDYVHQIQAIPGHEVALMLCPPNWLQDVRSASEKVRALRPPRTIDSLNQATLDEDWHALTQSWRKHWPIGADLDETAPRIEMTLPTHGSAATVCRISKLVGLPVDQVASVDEGVRGALEVLRLKAWLNTLVALEQKGYSEQSARPHLASENQRQLENVEASLAVGLGGIAPKYRRIVASQRTATGDHNRVAADARRTLSLLVSHEAVSSSGMGVVIPEDVPSDAFHALWALEEHWMQGARPKSEERLRARLDATMATFWSDEMLWAIHSAPRIVAFSNFPIGLLRPPGFSAPLAALKPIAYRPINPIQRALQTQLTPGPVREFDTRVRVMVAEGISPTDHVGVLSRAAWRATRDHIIDEFAGVEFFLAETLSRAALSKAVADYRPDVLVLSAHGFYQPEQNIAGVVLGQEPSIGDDLGPMPPLVILSACHTAPRGGSAVAITDLLLAEGAMAVVSTLVPVDVRHNASFTMRLLLYMLRSARGDESELDLLEVWHRVQTGNVINDIALSGKKLGTWMHTQVNGTSPLEEFMIGQDVSSIRTSHLYEDAEKRLLGVAEARGDRNRVANWLRDPGYLPESMMYTINGYPERLRLGVPR